MSGPRGGRSAGNGRAGKMTLAQHQERKIIEHLKVFVDQERRRNPSLTGDQILRDQEGILAYVKLKDLTLRRITDANLRKTIDQALQSFRASNEHRDENRTESDSEFEFDDDVPLMEVKDTNSMNRSLMGMYSNRKAVTTATESPLSALSNGPTATTQVQEAEIPATTAISNGADEDSAKPVAHSSRGSKRRLKESLAGSESKKVKRSGSSKEAKWIMPTARLTDLGGMDHIIEDILHLIGMPLKHPEVFSHLGIHPPRGVLLHGPPGCGKTMLAHAIAGEVGVPFFNVSAPSIVSGMSGESEKKLREIFEEAKQTAPCLLFIDEIDAITPKRETAQREMERRIVAQLLTCMDDISLENTDGKPVIVIGATNRPDSLDAALRRAGRFDREISIGVPDADARARILQKLCSNLRLSGDFDYTSLAKMTPGYVGADLNALTAEAGMIAVKRIFDYLRERSAKDSTTPDAGNNDEAMDVDTEESSHSSGALKDGIEELLSNRLPVMKFLSTQPDPLTEEELDPLCIVSDDFTKALKKVQPSAKREGFATVPDVSWDDIGALSRVREEMRMAIVEPIKHPEYFASMGITASMGVLLYGPPGCGKTLLAKAVANESHCNFISVKGPELLNKYVGESERAVRMVFARAQASSPCVIFFDELDALCPARSNEAENQSASRLVNTLLTEMDGMQGRKNVYVIAATNRPDMIDPAMLRPGRLDKALYVDLPNNVERRDILRAVARKTPLCPTLDLQTIADDSRCDGFSGADLASLVREAAVAALREQLALVERTAAAIPPRVSVALSHFSIAFSKISPSVNKKDRRRYELLRVKFGSSVDQEEPEKTNAPASLDENKQASSL